MYFVVRVRYRRKESSRSLSHLLMSFLLLKLANNRQTNRHRTLLGGGDITTRQSNQSKFIMNFNSKKLILEHKSRVFVIRLFH